MIYMDKVHYLQFDIYIQEKIESHFKENRSDSLAFSYQQTNL